MAFPGRNGILLFNLAPVVGRLGEFELKEVVGELNSEEKGMELPCG
jgi:hypothetical protein